MGERASRVRAVTLQDVADAAGVSRATASRVVTGRKFVDPSVADRVRAAIATLGYVPNQAARSLSTSRTDVVALVAGEPDARFFHDPFFAAIVRGVAQELGEVDMRLMMAMIQQSGDLARVENYLLGRPVDGVLVISEHATHQIARQVRDSRLPVVLGGRPMDVAAGAIPYVDNENRAGARMAVTYLRDRGARRIATIAGPLDMSAGVDRFLGYQDALGEGSDGDLVATGDFTIAGGRAAMETLLARSPDIDAVFAASDLMALGAMEALRRVGKRIPEDVAVVGFDDIDMAASAAIPLTTIRQDSVLQGRMMVRLLLTLLGRAEDLSKAARESVAGTTSVVLPVSLVRRASA